MKFSNRNDPLRIFLFVALLFSMTANYIMKSDNDFMTGQARELKAGILDSVVGYECEVEFDDGVES